MSGADVELGAAPRPVIATSTMRPCTRGAAMSVSTYSPPTRSMATSTGPAAAVISSASTARVDVAGGEHRVVEAEGPALLELLGGAGGAHDGAARCVGELHRGGADPGARGVHEHDLAGSRPRPG